MNRWQSVLQQSQIESDKNSLDQCERTTLPAGTRPSCVLYPESVEDVQNIVKSALMHGDKLYPLSRGKNWGYGDKCAVGDGQVIVDLSRMNKIIEVNTELSYAVIEPGVSQGQLYEFLNKNNIPLMIDVTGAGPDASIMGNVLERGFGHTPNGDHFLSSAGYEVVLADGRVLHTGFGHFKNSKTGYLQKWGVGASLDGIFAQSNLGIVTKMAIHLMPKPKKLKFFISSFDGDGALARVVEKIRYMLEMGIVSSTIHIGNDWKALSHSGKKHGDYVKEGESQSGAIERLRKETGAGEWNFSGAFYGNETIVRAQVKELKKALKPEARVIVLCDDILFAAKKILSGVRWIKAAEKLYRKILVGEQLSSLLQGEPVAESLKSAFWRVKEVGHLKKTDPLDNGCGLIWFAPILPMTGRDVARFVGEVKRIYQESDLEPLITLSCVSHRVICAVLCISFDKKDASETERAATCHKKLWDKAMEMGYPPYRCGTQSMKDLCDPNDVFWQVTGQIKKALDPQGILAPGRYECEGVK